MCLLCVFNVFFGWRFLNIYLLWLICIFYIYIYIHIILQIHIYIYRYMQSTGFVHISAYLFCCSLFCGVTPSRTWRMPWVSWIRPLQLEKKKPWWIGELLVNISSFNKKSTWSFIFRWHGFSWIYMFEKVLNFMNHLLFAELLHGIFVQRSTRWNAPANACEDGQSSWRLWDQALKI